MAEYNKRLYKLYLCISIIDTCPYFVYSISQEDYDDAFHIQLEDLTNFQQSTEKV